MKKVDEPDSKASAPPDAGKGAQPVRVISNSAAMMGTIFECTVAVAGSSDEAEKATNEALKEISRVESLMTTWRPDSYLSKVNAAAGVRSVAVPRELLELVNESLGISRLTEGKFDISFAAMSGVWNFKAPSPSLPNRALVRKRLPLIDYKSIKVDLEHGVMGLGKKGMSVGLGAIAKGYAVDRAAAVLKERGFNDFIVYGGGDLKVSGSKGGRPWSVGIQDPRNKKRYFARFNMESDGAVVTSGDYESFFYHKGVRYHHIIDPATGFPARGTVSVTIADQKAARADALATGIFVLGPVKGMALIESDPKLEGVIVDEDLKVHVSSGLKSRLVLTPIQPNEEEEQP